ncbi:hypothetical protein CC86DRAFT_463708 [Ophiobolus disseminans]|uniref:Uncharacterized protein n=1 Tax=Ophiobolus disseminans TaxID=1469910 RepID=A0A6A7ACH4_9PLEO|nr:hypothetical protein CC86DRAFT_463708 [Ophiobolus disseminans]
MSGPGRRGRGTFHPGGGRGQAPQWQSAQTNQPNQLRLAKTSSSVSDSIQQIRVTHGFLEEPSQTKCKPLGAHMDGQDRTSQAKTTEELSSHTMDPLNPPNTLVPVFDRRLFAINLPGYHPDDLLNQIPKPIPAVNHFTVPPYRSIPPDLITAITTPPPTLTEEPDWSSLLSYFASPHANHGLTNLQDLYLWLTRVGISNAVIDNRRFLLHFYMRNTHASPNVDLRYDTYSTPEEYIPLTNEARPSAPYLVPNHHVFEFFQTPDGRRFAQWLRNNVYVPAPGQMPVQLRHRVSVLDGYLDENETAVRQVDGRALVKRTVRVLKMYWWLWGTLRVLQAWQERGWVGMEGFGA